MSHRSAGTRPSAAGRPGRAPASPRAAARPHSRPQPLGTAWIPLLFLLLAIPRAEAAQRYACDVEVAVGQVARVDLPVEAPVDLTAFLAGIGGALDPLAFRVVEVDAGGGVLDDAVPFQFDAAAAFDPATHAVGELVFVLNGATPALGTRRYRVLFDVAGACGDCPAPPAVPAPMTLDSLQYEGQATWLIGTPRADYYYHRAGGGFASIIDNEGRDWISYRNAPGSGERGEWRGIPNLNVSVPGISNGTFHPGHNTVTTTLVGHGPLKVTLRSVYPNPLYRWSLLWEIYPTFARMTVEEAGPDDSGNYWLLYEGTPGGALDLGDIIVRADGTVTSAANNADQWETVLADPQWLYFRDTTRPRYLFLSDDDGDNYPDAHRSMGQTDGGPWSGMVVFGFGRVLETTLDPLRPRMYGADRTFTMGLGEDHLTAPADIAAVTRPVVVTVGAPAGIASAVGDDVPRGIALGRNSPNPFNPATTIRFTLAGRGPVNLSVFDPSGRLVRTLVNADLEPGPHAAVWDGRGDDGRLAASGTYLYRLKARGDALAGKMTLAK
jgi:hypothetical protein